jgi:hypothetical protein
MNNTGRGSLCLEGKGKEKYWTSRALLRAGFTIDDENRKMIVRVLPGRKWELHSGDKVSDFSSIHHSPTGSQETGGIS